MFPLKFGMPDQSTSYGKYMFKHLSFTCYPILDMTALRPRSICMETLDGFIMPVEVII